MTPAEFVKWLMPYAQKIQTQYGIPAEWMVAIAANETGYGRYASGNNLFGIKGTGPAGSFASKTWEVINGVRVDIVDYFRAYHDPSESFADFANLVTTSSRYTKALSATTVTDFTHLLQLGGYATDPNWHLAVTNRYNEMGFTASGTPVQPPASGNWWEPKTKPGDDSGASASSDSIGSPLFLFATPWGDIPVRSKWGSEEFAMSVVAVLAGLSLVALGAWKFVQ